MHDTPLGDRVEVAALLVSNRERREVAARELSAAKEELRGLFLRGQVATMDVSEMAGVAGVSRDTVHRILKEAGTMSWRQKQAWATEVLALVPRGTFAQNQFRSLLQITLYRALGARGDDVPHTVEGVFAHAIESMRTIGGEPDFEPDIDSSRLSELRWPTEPFEIVQRGSRETASFQIRLGGFEVAPWRSSAEDIASDLNSAGGTRPAYIDRTGPECVTQDGRRIGWDLLSELQ
jgi:hypothetical protein